MMPASPASSLLRSPPHDPVVVLDYNPVLPPSPGDTTSDHRHPEAVSPVSSVDVASPRRYDGGDWEAEPGAEGYGHGDGNSGSEEVDPVFPEEGVADLTGRVLEHAGLDPLPASGDDEAPPPVLETTCVSRCFDQYALSAIHSLTLSNNALTRSCFHDVPHLPALRHLDLTGNRLGTRVPKADAVEWLIWASSLRSLDLSNNGFTRVPRLDSVPELRSLVLSWNAIKLLTNVDRVTGLLELDLSHNAFTGLIALRSLSLNQRLEAVSFKGCPLATVPRYRSHIQHLLPRLLSLDGETTSAGTMRLKQTRALQAKQRRKRRASSGPRQDGTSATTATTASMRARVAAVKEAASPEPRRRRVSPIDRPKIVTPRRYRHVKSSGYGTVSPSARARKSSSYDDDDSGKGSDSRRTLEPGMYQSQQELISRLAVPRRKRQIDNARKLRVIGRAAYAFGRVLDVEDAQPGGKARGKGKAGGAWERPPPTRPVSPKLSTKTRSLRRLQSVAQTVVDSVRDSRVHGNRSTVSTRPTVEVTPGTGAVLVGVLRLVSCRGVRANTCCCAQLAQLMGSDDPSIIVSPSSGRAREQPQHKTRRHPRRRSPAHQATQPHPQAQPQSDSVGAASQRGPRTSPRGTPLAETRAPVPTPAVAQPLLTPMTAPTHSTPGSPAEEVGTSGGWWWLACGAVRLCCPAYAHPPCPGHCPPAAAATAAHDDARRAGGGTGAADTPHRVTAWGHTIAPVRYRRLYRVVTVLSRQLCVAGGGGVAAAGGPAVGEDAERVHRAAGWARACVWCQRRHACGRGGVAARHGGCNGGGS